MRIKQIRRTNLMRLIDAEGGKLSTFAEKAQRNDPTISANFLSQIKNGTKTIGDAFAAKLEAALDLGEGFLDHDHSQSEVAFSPDLLKAHAMALPPDERKQIAIALVESLGN